jgi:hypothetical protein
MKEHPELIRSKCNGGKRQDLQEQYFRSNWEANFARILNYLGIKWSFEKESFRLSTGKHYIPDFHIGNNCFIEIKGWWDNDSKEKIELFRKEYSNFSLEIISLEEYKFLRFLFKELINWEGR